MPFREDPAAALSAIHSLLWDPDRRMVRYAPGETPGIDLSSFNLHTVRESALGAFLDLEEGQFDRGIEALNCVLELQYPTSSWPWSGTFPVTAEQADPPGEEAVEWLHYDPNWRQFLGCILSMTLAFHDSSLPVELQGRLWSALGSCVRGEPEQRIPDWYTNPNLMHAWLQARVGRHEADDDLISAGERRARMILERFERFGDVDEYNSPTYDGIDLFALTLWVELPPSEAFETMGASILDRISTRLSVLYHRELGALCGPYIRAYGLELNRYVSLIGMWLFLAGEPPSSVLPPHLTGESVHLHDLYFLPLFSRLAHHVTSRLTLSDMVEQRRYEQSFEGSRASSLLRDGQAIGWDSGRRHDFAIDQYVPFTTHFVLDGSPCSFGIKLASETAFVDCNEIGDGWFQLMASAHDSTVGLRLVVGADATSTEFGMVLGPLEVIFSSPADSLTSKPTPTGFEYHFTWLKTEVAARVHLTVATDG